MMQTWVASCNSSSIVDEDHMQQAMAQFDSAVLSFVQGDTDALPGDDGDPDLRNENKRA